MFVLIHLNSFISVCFLFGKNILLDLYNNMTLHKENIIIQIYKKTTSLFH